MTHYYKTNRKSRLGALLSLELVIVLPVLLVVVFATVEFSFLLLGSQAITAAANVGARQAALPSSTAEDVRFAVFQALNSWKWTHTEGALQVLIFVDEDGDGIQASDLVYDSLSASLDDETANVVGTAQTGTDIQVTINLQSIDAAPDLLSIVNLGLQDQELTASFVSRKE
jgi:Flp pilus assembly protein TadG